MKIFFIGISGTFMGNLAQMASHLGHDVVGVDQKVYPPMSDELSKSGISFKEGYTEENFQDADIYILGNVISKNNPLLIKILSHGKNIIEYDVTSKGAKNHIKLAQELINNNL